MDKIRILLVDDQPQVRQGLQMRLAVEPDMVVVGEAEDGVAALARARALVPDVVLMDVWLPRMNGLATAAALGGVAPESAVVFLSLQDDPGTRAMAQAAGAVAFIGKDEPRERLLAAIRQAAGREPAAA